MPPFAARMESAPIDDDELFPPTMHQWSQNSEGHWSRLPSTDLATWSPTAVPGPSIAFLHTAHDRLPGPVLTSLRQTLGWRPTAVTGSANARFEWFRFTDDDEGGDVSSLAARFLTVAAEKGPPDPRTKLTREMSELRHIWGTVDVVVRWTRGSAVLVVMPWTNHVLEERILRALRTRYAGYMVGGGDAFALLAVAMEGIIAAFDEAIWSWRDHIRYFEIRRGVDDNPEFKYKLMHELARHAINCSESLESGTGALEMIIEEHGHWCEEMSVEGDADMKERQAVGRELRAYKVLLSALHLRSAYLRERLKNEISLAFTAVNQQQSMASVRIAEAAQTDSASTMTISVLGLLFFPFTVVSSVFSTTFFTNSTVTDASGASIQIWQMSDRFWVFWAFALPLTIITIAAWLCWYRFYLRPMRRREAIIKPGVIQPSGRESQSITARAMMRFRGHKSDLEKHAEAVGETKGDETAIRIHQWTG